MDDLGWVTDLMVCGIFMGIEASVEAIFVRLTTKYTAAEAATITTKVTNIIGKTSIHGAERIAGEGATRGGVLSLEEIGIVRSEGVKMTANNGTIVHMLKQSDGRFSAVVDGEKGLVTTFKNFSEKSIQKLSTRYGWK